MQFGIHIEIMTEVARQTLPNGQRTYEVHCRSLKLLVKFQKGWKARIEKENQKLK